MQFLAEREIEQQTFSSTRPGQLGSRKIDSRGVYHQIMLSLLGNLVVNDIETFRLKLNNDAVWDVNGKFLDNRRRYDGGEAADNIGKLLIDFTQPNQRVPNNDFVTSLNVAGNGVRANGFVESFTMEQRINGDAPPEAEIDIRALIGDPIEVDGQSTPAGSVIRIDNFNTRVNNGVVDMRQFTEGGLTNARSMLKRIYLGIDPRHIRTIEIRDESELRTELTVDNMVRRQIEAGFKPKDLDFVVIDPQLDDDLTHAFDLFQFRDFNVRLNLEDFDTTATPDEITVFAEYAGTLV